MTKIDHSKIQKGVYVRKVDSVPKESPLTHSKVVVFVTTYDIRICAPYTDVPMSVSAAHTIEHIILNLLESSSWWSRVIYFGLQANMTGFSLIMKGLPDYDVVRLVRDAFGTLLTCDHIPNRSKEDCSNWEQHNLLEAKAFVKDFVESEWWDSYPR